MFSIPEQMMTHKNPNSPTSLTEFAPHSADIRQSTGLLSRIFRRSGESTYNHEDSDQFCTGESSTPVDGSETELPASDDSNQESMDNKSELSASLAAGVPLEPAARTLPSVLMRLRRIVAGSSQTPQAYKDSDFKQYWMPDSNCHECYECNCRFHAFRRRHHCRICGQIFCSQCCNNQVPGKIMGFTGSLRVCTYCCKIVLHYADNLDGPGDDLDQVAALPDSQTTATREMYESPSRLTIGLTDPGSLNTVSSNLGRRSSKSHRLSSIFDEDLKRSRSSSDLESPLCNMEACCEERKPVLQDPSQLRDLWLLMKNPVDGIVTQTHRHRLRSYPNCMTGRHIVDWLIAKDKAISREQAVALGQVLLDAKWLESTSMNDSIFKDDYTSYRPAEMALRDSTPETSTQSSSVVESDGDDEPQWFKEIKQPDKDEQISELSGELNKIPSTVSAPRDECPDINAKSVFFVEHFERNMTAVSMVVSGLDNKDSVEPLFAGSSLSLGASSGFSGAFHGGTSQIPVDNISVDQEETEQSGEVHGNDLQNSVYRNQLSKIQREHLTVLVMQLLHKNGLSTKWADTILTTAQKVSQVVRPDVRRENDEMDIRQYVRIKKVPGELKSNTCIISGVACTKNVAHKKMRQSITNPRILLLRAPIEYQRVENKFSSLEPQILQENEFLKNCVSRIAKLQPDILLVEKTVSRLAQGFLLDAGITLVLNVKATVMERVARMTRAVVATSIDGLVTKTTMGTCRNFYLHTFTLQDGVTKTLMYFDGCDIHLGCTVTLRGGLLGELRRVKQILSFIIYAMYHSCLELEFLLDELAIPPQMEDVADQSIDDDTPRRSDEPQPSSRLRQQSSGETADDYNGLENELDDANNSVFVGPNADEESGCSNDGGTAIANGSNLEIPKQDASPLVKKELITIAPVTDLSDPLHSYQILNDETIFDYSSAPPLMEEKRNTSRQFKKALSEVTLTISPYVKVDLPYLETEAGSRCKLRSCFPLEVFWSEVFHPKVKDTNHWRKLSDVESVVMTCASPDVFFLPPHPFVLDKLSSPVTDSRIQAELADFRARGGRIPFACAQNGFLTNIPVTSAQVPSKVRAPPGDRESETPVDCLDSAHHQRISLLFSSFSVQSLNAPHPCVFPWTVTMNFYSRTDITLGGFLEKYCFSESYRCVNRTCDTPMVDHVRRFVHGSSSIQVVLKKLDAPVFSPPDAIYVWNWCRKCKRLSPKIPLSAEAYQMSFAKYMELRFHANKYVRRSSGTCRHSLHHEHFQYFGNQQIVASFKYSNITLREVAFPPIVVTILPPEFTLQQQEDDGKMLNFRATSVFGAILEQLQRLKKEALSESQTAYVMELVFEVEKEQESIMQKIEYVQSMVTNAKRLEQHDDYNIGVQVEDAFVEIKHQVADVVTSWNERIHDLELQQKKTDKSRLQPVASSSNVAATVFAKQTKDVAVNSSASNVPDNVSVQADEGSVVVTVSQSNEEERGDVSENKTQGSATADSSVLSSTRSSSSSVDVTTAVPSPLMLSNGAPDVTTELVVSTLLDAGTEAQPERVSPSLVGKVPSVSSSPPKSAFLDITEQLPTSHSTPSLNQPRSRSSSDLRKLKGLSKDGSLPEVEKKDRATAVKQMFSSLLSTSGNTTVPIPFPTEEHHLLSLSCSKVPVVVYDQEPSSIIAYALSCHEYEKQLQELKVSQAVANEGTSVKKGARLGDIQTEADVKKGVVSFLKTNATREKSPNRSANKFLVDAVFYTPNSDRDSLEDADEVDGFQMLADISQKSSNKVNKQQPQNFHIELQFSDCNAKFYCRVCYAEQFAKLRKLIFPEGEERKEDKWMDEIHDVTGRNLEELRDLTSNRKQWRMFIMTIARAPGVDSTSYIRSLSRCFTWLAGAGKSGSSFCKTQDNRFILKQMSKIEVQSFSEFAPHYFQYITKAYEAEKPTAIAKILGVYRIGYQNSKTTAALKQDLLVMENLFYGCKISQIFDLKGSARNRLVNTSGKRVEDMVLLDENLVKISTDSPMYVYPHSKAVLMASITRDTEFLTHHSVMDYSLLVGVDESKKQFVIGIIDYIRTFTWDKKVEMLVKGAYGKEQPTVVSPDIYKRRFLDAMDRYFLLVPDRWVGFTQSVDCSIVRPTT